MIGFFLEFQTSVQFFFFLQTLKSSHSLHLSTQVSGQIQEFKEEGGGGGVACYFKTLCHALPAQEVILENLNLARDSGGGGGGHFRCLDNNLH